MLLLLFLASPSCCSSSSWECSPRELSSLNRFKQELLDPYDHLASWKGSYCCSWMGIACQSLTGHVVHLDLSYTNDNSLSAVVGNSSSQIFPTLFQLHHLEYLDLSWIVLSPLPFPSHLPTSLTRLTHLGLAGCGLAGSIPAEIGNMSRLTFLDISYNYDLEMRQSSSWIRNLRGLEHLGLGNLDMSIDVVDNVASLSNLTSLSMPRRLSGALLPPLANLTSLSHLDMSDSNFSQQPFPTWISNLTSLVSLDLSDCDLHGSIASAVLRLSHLKDLDLSYNPLLNVDLSFFAQHAFQLRNLFMPRSNVGGMIPNSIGNLSRLQVLVLYENSLRGNIANSVGNLSRLQLLDLSENSLRGNIPNSVGHLSRLEVLDLSKNMLRGNIPWSSLGKLSKLSDISLGSNQLNGSLSSTIGNRSSLQSLDLSNNSLSGTFFLSQLENSKQLSYLDLSNNS